jgi:hypothetical protein
MFMVVKVKSKQCGQHKSEERHKNHTPLQGTYSG